MVENRQASEPAATQKEDRRKQEAGRFKKKKKIRRGIGEEYHEWP
jgi:hypothetical protein